MGETVYIDKEFVLDHHFICGVTTRQHEGRHVPALSFGGQVIVLPDAKPAFNPNTDKPDGFNGKVRWRPLPRSLEDLEKRDAERLPNGEVVV
jgi:hypothetical protein